MQRGNQEFRLPLVPGGVVVVVDDDLRRRQRAIRLHAGFNRVAEVDETTHDDSLAAECAWPAATRQGGGNGAGDRPRTGYLNLGKVALYQVSYARFLARP